MRSPTFSRAREQKRLRRAERRKAKRAGLRRGGSSLRTARLSNSRHARGRIAESIGQVFAEVGQQIAASRIGNWLRGLFGRSEVA